MEASIFLVTGKLHPVIAFPGSEDYLFHFSVSNSVTGSDAGGIQAAAEILERSICKFAWTYDSEKL